jgi:hypothetical protein
MGSVFGGRRVLQIPDVRNGSAVGGTGMIAIRSWRGGTLVDENVNFAVIGFAKPPSSFDSVEYQVEGSKFTNYSPMHKFTMKFDDYLPSGTWIRVTFPPGFTFGTTRCWIDELNDNIDCK